MRQRILNGTLPLGQQHPDPIHDGEAFITHLVNQTLDDWGMYITQDEHQELILDLLTEALKLEQTFNPQRNTSYAGYASWILRKRVVDLGPRKLLGRNGQRAAERTHTQLTDDNIIPNLYAPEHDHNRSTTTPYQPDQTDDRHLTPRPHNPHPQRPSNPRADRPTDDRRLENERTRRRARANTILGLRAA